MATAKTSAKSASRKSKPMDEQIISGYKEYVLLNGHSPASVFQFMHSMKKEESTFYDHFSSFRALHMAIWDNYASSTIEALQSDEGFEGYNAREKMLAFYYTLLEVLKKDRSFVRYSFEQVKRPEVVPDFLKKFRERFMEFASGILNQGREQDEIVDRPVLSSRYKDGLWVQMLFIMRFWLRDDSTGFTKTDAAVEKSVNLSFELMGRGPLDQMIDFAKFLYHNK